MMEATQCTVQNISDPLMARRGFAWMLKRMLMSPRTSNMCAMSVPMITRKPCLSQWRGKAFDQSNIGKRITAFWFKAKQIKLSSTDVRKIASSATFDMDIVEKRAIHEHMAHKEVTADHYYNIGHITKKSSKGHQLLKKSLGLDRSVLTMIETRHQVSKIQQSQTMKTRKRMNTMKAQTKKDSPVVKKKPSRCCFPTK